MAKDWRKGDRIENRWEMYDVLGGPGASGMGIVYVVYDYLSHRALALKTFQDAVFAQNPAIADRFRDEATAWVHLDRHLNVTHAHGVQIIQNKPYLFLEYVPGGNLRDWLRARRLTDNLPLVLRLGIQFCDGMIHAASKGIVAHRDVKPENCLLTDTAILKVTDFGLARVFDAPTPDDGALAPQRTLEAGTPLPRLGVVRTHTGVALGTPHYMPPEQFLDAKRVDVRGDVYAFGIMLHELIEGRRPFAARSSEEWARVHREVEPPRLEGCPDGIAELIARCLAKDPTRRPGDFGEVREWLVEVYEQEEYAARTDVGVPQPVVGEALSAKEWYNKGLSLAALGRDWEALACYDEALSRNPDDGATWGAKGESLARLGRYEEALEYVNQSLRRDHENAVAWKLKGVCLSELGCHEEALSFFDEALKRNAADVNIWYNKAGALTKVDRLEEAVVCYDEVLRRDPAQGVTWYNKGVCLGRLNRDAEAVACYDEALKRSPAHADSWYNKGA